MKKCINCGKENRNENQFCSTCGGTSFEAPYSTDEPAAVPPPLQTPPPAYQTPPVMMGPPPTVKKPFTLFDVLTILGFVSSLVGLVQIWVVLEPLALASSVLGFFKGNRSKGLAAAGTVIAVIAFIIRLFMTLYNNNIIGRWAIEGAFK
ncbi:MAG: zinc ribbon domain-containing protein [Ruminiclostridium sp.]|nr:zinc ribbon domain-containing protein [Ruminiclostridium sp.]